MKTVNILNPAAGQGAALKYKENENSYVTTAKNDATEFVKKTLAKGDDIHFNVYGGDGTVNEVVNGIVASEGKASFSIVPVGTGNDLLRTFQSSGKQEMQVDVLTVDGRYAVNAVNTGFDLDVVLKAAELKKKPLVSGTLAYILGVISVLCGKFGKYMTVEYTDADGNTHSYSGNCLMTVAANGEYYGGGFHCAPAARVDDGLIDLMIVKNISRFRFLTLVLQYMKGRHIDPKTSMPAKSFEKYLIFCKCKCVVIKDIDRICADGEIWDTNAVEVGIIPGAVTMKKGESN